MTHNRSWIFSTIVLLLSAMVFSGTATAAPGAEMQRPLRASIEFVDADPLFDCDEGLVPTGYVGGGNMSHLGKMELVGSACNNFADLTINDGYAMYIAANGDYFVLAFTGQASLTPDGFEGTGSGAISGGTGRFEAATGEFNFTFTTVLLPDGSGHTVLDGDGWITYDASDRSNK
jgi:hypothetical protein